MLFLYSSVICLFSLNIMFEEFVHVDPHGTFTQHVASHRLSQFTNPLPCWTFGLCPVFFFIITSSKSLLTPYPLEHTFKSFLGVGLLILKGIWLTGA